MKIGSQVTLKLIAPPADAQGKPAEIKGLIVSMTRAHCVVKLTSVPDGIHVAVRENGDHILLRRADNLPKDAYLLAKDEETVFARVDLSLVENMDHRPDVLTYEQAKERLGKYVYHLDHQIETGKTTPLSGNLFYTQEIEALKTICENFDHEHFRFSDEAKEFGKKAHHYLRQAFPVVS